MTIERLLRLEDELRLEVKSAFERLVDAIRSSAPRLALGLERWGRERLGGMTPAEYLVHPEAFPVMYLSRWCASAAALELPSDLAADITHSCTAGCLAIRLADDIMDEGAIGARRFAPALVPLSLEVIAPYRLRFATDPELVRRLESTWSRSFDDAYADALLSSIDEKTFRDVVAAKFSAATMPVLVVGWGQPATIDPWRRFLHAYAVWHQMLNDTLDWAPDLTHGVATYFLSEARREAGDCRKEITRWVFGRGLQWSAGRMSDYWCELMSAASALQCGELDAFLKRREVSFQSRVSSLRSASNAIGELSRLATGT